jgi:hypothetical protein
MVGLLAQFAEPKDVLPVLFRMGFLAGDETVETKEGDVQAVDHGVSTAFTRLVIPRPFPEGT